ncbi:acetylcholinesterase-like [Dermochelys coriacea]|uniref:acetylcholinesterase-like n=1 Tax=Dermochelys coriacea TaxID=27794 RepID=UPI001CA8590A|nr:acetylcholinesterase-like [Dermochelys coriacea]
MPGRWWRLLCTPIYRDRSQKGKGPMSHSPQPQGLDSILAIAPRRFISKQGLMRRTWLSSTDISSHMHEFTHSVVQTFQALTLSPILPPSCWSRESILHTNCRWGSSSLVWIHSGEYISGAPSLSIYDGRFLATTENVIVASMNYRLGAVGFLSLPPAAPGNAGLWDQRLALHWLRDNAAAFSGDPARVMLFGQSAGGSSVSFHLLSAGSRLLFSHAVSQSRAATAPWAWISLEEPKERGRRLGQLLGCTDGDDTALVGCLQGKEPREFPKHEISILHRKELMMIAFVPTPDGDFLPDTPSRLLRAGHSQPMPILTGFTPSEGSYMLKLSPLDFSLENISHIGWEELLQVVRLSVPGAPEEAIQIVARRYSQERQDEARYLWAMDQTTGDHLFVSPVAEMAGREAEAGSPVYTYYFTHSSPGSSLPEWMGVTHSSEVPYLFGTLVAMWGANYTLTEAETGLSRRVMQYWAEFASKGSPLSKPACVPLEPVVHNVV